MAGNSYLAYRKQMEQAARPTAEEEAFEFAKSLDAYKAQMDAPGMSGNTANMVTRYMDQAYSIYSQIPELEGDQEKIEARYVADTLIAQAFNTDIEDVMSHRGKYNALVFGDSRIDDRTFIDSFNKQWNTVGLNNELAALEEEWISTDDEYRRAELDRQIAAKEKEIMRAGDYNLDRSAVGGFLIDSAPVINQVATSAVITLGSMALGGIVGGAINLGVNGIRAAGAINSLSAIAKAATGAKTAAEWGYRLGMIADGYWNTFKPQFGLAIHNRRQYRDANGQPMDEGVMYWSAMADALLNTAIEYVTPDIFGRNILSSTAGRKLLERSALETGRNAAIRFGKDWICGAANESLEEALQSMASMLVEDMTYRFTRDNLGVELNPDDLRGFTDYFKAFSDSFIQSMGPMLLTGGFMTAGKMGIKAITNSAAKGFVQANFAPDASAFDITASGLPTVRGRFREDWLKANFYDTTEMPESSSGSGMTQDTAQGQQKANVYSTMYDEATSETTTSTGTGAEAQTRQDSAPTVTYNARGFEVAKYDETKGSFEYKGMRLQPKGQLQTIRLAEMGRDIVTYADSDSVYTAMAVKSMGGKGARVVFQQAVAKRKFDPKTIEGVADFDEETKTIILKDGETVEDVKEILESEGMVVHDTTSAKSGEPAVTVTRNGSNEKLNISRRRGTAAQESSGTATSTIENAESTVSDGAMVPENGIDMQAMMREAEDAVETVETAQQPSGQDAAAKISQAVQPSTTAQDAQPTQTDQPKRATTSTTRKETAQKATRTMNRREEMSAVAATEPTNPGFREEGDEWDLGAELKTAREYTSRQLQTKGSKVSDESVGYAAEALVAYSHVTGISVSELAANGTISFHILTDQENIDFFSRIGFARGRTTVKDRNHIVIDLTRNADTTTLLHEVGHAVRLTLPKNQLKEFVNFYSKSGAAFVDEINEVSEDFWTVEKTTFTTKEAAEEYAEKNGKKESDIKQGVKKKWMLGYKAFKTFEAAYNFAMKNEEKFADDFVRYIVTGEAPTPSLRKVFSGIRKFFNAIMDLFKTKVSPVLRKAFDNLFTSGEESIRKGGRRSVDLFDTDIPTPFFQMMEDPGDPDGRTMEELDTGTTAAEGWQTVRNTGKRLSAEEVFRLMEAGCPIAYPTIRTALRQKGLSDRVRRRLERLANDKHAIEGLGLVAMAKRAEDLAEFMTSATSAISGSDGEYTWTKGDVERRLKLAWDWSRRPTPEELRSQFLSEFSSRDGILRLKKLLLHYYETYADKDGNVVTRRTKINDPSLNRLLSKVSEDASDDVFNDVRRDMAVNTRKWQKWFNTAIAGSIRAKTGSLNDTTDVLSIQYLTSFNTDYWFGRQEVRTTLSEATDNALSDSDLENVAERTKLIDEVEEDMQNTWVSRIDDADVDDLLTGNVEEATAELSRRGEAEAKAEERRRGSLVRRLDRTFDKAIKEADSTLPSINKETDEGARAEAARKLEELSSKLDTDIAAILKEVTDADVEMMRKATANMKESAKNELERQKQMLEERFQAIRDKDAERYRRVVQNTRETKNRVADRYRTLLQKTRSLASRRLYEQRLRYEKRLSEKIEEMDRKVTLAYLKGTIREREAASYRHGRDVNYYENLVADMRRSFELAHLEIGIRNALAMDTVRRTYQERIAYITAMYKEREAKNSVERSFQNIFARTDRENLDSSYIPMLQMIAVIRGASITMRQAVDATDGAFVEDAVGYTAFVSMDGTEVYVPSPDEIMGEENVARFADIVSAAVAKGKIEPDEGRALLERITSEEERVVRFHKRRRNEFGELEEFTAKEKDYKTWTAEERNVLLRVTKSMLSDARRMLEERTQSQRNEGTRKAIEMAKAVTTETDTAYIKAADKYVAERWEQYNRQADKDEVAQEDRQTFSDFSAEVRGEAGFRERVNERLMKDAGKYYSKVVHGDQAGKVRMTFRTINRLMLKPMSLMMRLDGKVDPDLAISREGPFWKHFIDDVFKNRMNERKSVNKRYDAFTEYVKKEMGLTPAQLMDREHLGRPVLLHYETVGGNGSREIVDGKGKPKLTAADVLGIWLHAKGGMNSDKVTKMTDLHGNNISKNDVEAIIGGKFLTEDERALGQWMLDDMAENYGRVSQVAYDTENKLMLKLDNYWPRVPDRLPGVELFGSLNVNRVHSKLMRIWNGFSETVAPGTVYPLRLNAIETWFSSVDAQEKYIANNAWAMETRRMLDDRTNGNLGSIIRAYATEQDREALRGYYNRIVGPGETLQDYMGMFSRLVGNVNAARISLSITSALRQFISLPTAKLVLGKDIHLAKGLLHVLSNYSAAMEEIRAADPTMRDRAMDQNMEMFTGSVQASMGGGKLRKLQKAGLALSSFTDNLVAGAVWYGVYDKAVSDRMSEQDAVMKASQAIQATQSTTEKMSQSEIQANRNPLVRFALSFTNDLFQVWNLTFFQTGTYLRGMMQDMKSGRGKEARSKFMTAVGRMMIPIVAAGLSSVVAFGWLPEDDEDEEGFSISDFLDDFWSELVSYIPGFGIFAQDAVQGYQSESPAVSYIKDLFAVGTDTLDVIRGEAEPSSLLTTAKDVAQDAAEVTGLWSNFLNRVFRSVWDTDDEEFQLNFGYILSTDVGDWLDSAMD